jgi:hypothetical protein
VTAHRFPYVQVDPSLGAASALPFMPITLIHGQQEIEASALVDSGAALNVIPYNLGVQLGVVWEQQTVPVALSGNLAASEARALLLTGQVADFAPVRLAFAWSRSNNVPLILGQVNFFMEFDVCFFRAQLFFEIRLAGNTED